MAHEHIMFLQQTISGKILIIIFIILILIYTYNIYTNNTNIISSYISLNNNIYCLYSKNLFILINPQVTKALAIIPGILFGIYILIIKYIYHPLLSWLVYILKYFIIGFYNNNYWLIYFNIKIYRSISYYLIFYVITNIKYYGYYLYNTEYLYPQSGSKYLINHIIIISLLYYALIYNIIHNLMISINSFIIHTLIINT